MDEATWVCARGLAANPNYATGRAIMGEILAQAGLKARAAEEFQCGIGLDPQNNRGRLGLAQLYLDAGKAKEALAQADEVLFWQPGNDQAYYLHEQAIALLDAKRVELLVAEPQQAPAPAPAAPTAPAAPPGLIPGRERELARLLMECETIAGVMVVDNEGLLVSGEAELGGLRDEAAALLARLCENSNRYFQKLSLGALEGGLVEEGSRAARVLRYQNYAVAVSLKPEAKLGTAEVEIAGAMGRLDRRRKTRADDRYFPEPPAEAKHA